MSILLASHKILLVRIVKVQIHAQQSHDKALRMVLECFFFFWPIYIYIFFFIQCYIALFLRVLKISYSPAVSCMMSWRNLLAQFDDITVPVKVL